MIVLSQLPHAVLVLFLFLLDFGLFLLPGFAVALSLFARRQMTALLTIVTVVASSASFGYVAFWAFFLSRTLGQCFCAAVYIIALLQIVRSLFRDRRVGTLLRLLRTPLLYTGLTGLLYTSLLFSFSDPVASREFLAGQRFFREARSGDNLIPLILADRIYGHRPLRPFCCGDWLSSDRPPLQSGIFLLERPLRVLAGTGLHYQALSTGLQCLWVCGVWCLLVALGTEQPCIRLAIMFLSFSGFLFYNTAYTWPKLLASACLLFFLSLILEVVRHRRAATALDVVLASASLGLALMAHPGTVFSLPAFVLLAFRTPRILSLRQAGVAFLIVAGFAVPWMAYQKVVDPPGDRLLKLHLAGENDILPFSTWTAVRNAYGRHSLTEILGYKLSNLALLLGHRPWDMVGLGVGAAESSRVAQREWIWNAVGLLNAGWLAWLIAVFRRRSRRPAIPYAHWLIIAALVNLVLWSAAMFGPRATVTTHSSYTDILLISVGLIGWIFTLPGWIVAAIFVGQVFNVMFIWTLSSPHVILVAQGAESSPVPQVPLMLAGVLLTATLGALAYLSWQSCRDLARGPKQT